MVRFDARMLKCASRAAHELRQRTAPAEPPRRSRAGVQPQVHPQAPSAPSPKGLPRSRPGIPEAVGRIPQSGPIATAL